MPRVFQFDQLVNTLSNLEGLEFLTKSLTDGKLQMRCELHGEFSITPGNLRRGTRCPNCAAELKKGDTNPVQQRAKARALETFKKAHGDRYDYSRVNYSGAHNPVIIGCPEHGWFEQSPVAHRNGHGCDKCASKTRVAKRKATGVDLFVERITKRFDGNVEVVVHPTTMSGSATLRCKKHNRDFTVRAIGGLRSGGCPDCVNESRVEKLLALGVHRKGAETKKEEKRSTLEAEAVAVHGDKYDYSYAKYEDAKSKFKIVCKACGEEFFQTYGHHVYRRHGCPRCSHHKSKCEAEIHQFVSIFDASVQSRVRGLVGGQLELDIYSEKHKLAVEYCGMYWHSSSSVEEEAKVSMKHWEKYKGAENAGISLLTVYETDWDKRKQAVKRIIRAKLGKLKGKLFARKCEIGAVTSEEARVFFDKYHVQGGNGNGLNYGLFWNKKLVACMRFSYGNNDRGKSAREWTLSRYATRVSVVGGASKLFSYFIAQTGAQSVKSFSDNRFFDGGMYDKLGFKLEAELRPDYAVWHPKLGLLPKTKFQRSELAKRQQDLRKPVDFDPESDTRSETDLTYELGCSRIFDCGKKRWRWTPPR